MSCLYNLTNANSKICFIKCTLSETLHQIHYHSLFIEYFAGKNDLRVPPSQGYEFYHSLKVSIYWTIYLKYFDDFIF